MKPIIGITSSHMKKNDYVEGPYTHKDYAASLIRAGGIPFILPTTTDKATIEAYLSYCDGILFSGGCDVDPRFYNQDPSIHTEDVDIQRDRIEFALIRGALKKKKPIMGICRGIQVINVALGGTLIQDINDEIEEPIQHEQKAARGESSHSVRLVKGSLLFHMLGDRDAVYVNSLHHQSVAKVADSLKAVAFSGDGVIEAVEARDGSNLFAVQWHPESMAMAGDKQMLNLFKTFVGKCMQKSKVRLEA
mgnify:CR=1 FL=1